jgi:integrase
LSGFFASILTLKLDQFFGGTPPPACKRQTYEQYESVMRLYILPKIGGKLVDEVKPMDVQDIINTMARKGKSTRTMKHARIITHIFYVWLETNGYVKTSPCIRIKVPQVETRPRRSLSKEEIPLLLEAMSHSRWIHSVRFLLLTGLRRGEFLALRWKDVDDGYIHVRRSRSVHCEEGTPKSAAGRRDIKIGKAVQAILDDQKDMLIKEGITPVREIVKVDDKDMQKLNQVSETTPAELPEGEEKPAQIICDYVFPSQTGEPLHPNTYSRSLHRIAMKSKIQITPHELRHTFVSIAGRGMDLKSLQAVLGHTSSTMTLDLYRHLIEGDIDRAADVVDSAAAALGMGPKTEAVIDIREKRA